jgi:hypothetical protein
MLGLGLAALAAPVVSRAQTPAPFDLGGPTLHVSVTHDGRTLPIAEVPNLAAGDQLTIRRPRPGSSSRRPGRRKAAPA